MTMTVVFLAGVFRIGEENSIRALIPVGSTVAQVIIYAGALLVVALAVFVWAVFFRRQRRPRSHSHRHRSKPAAGHHPSPAEPSRFRTLADAGGLPPIRNQPPPASPP
jgi:hypothetical protein